jgi:hypothetical protein
MHIMKEGHVAAQYCMHISGFFCFRQPELIWTSQHAMRQGIETL